MPGLFKLPVTSTRSRAGADEFAPLVDGPALRNRRPSWSLARLPAALGIIATLMSGFSAEAGDLLRGAGWGGGSAAGSGGSGVGQPVASSAQAASAVQDLLARNTQAIQAVQAMQAAAHQAAVAGANQLGKQLPAVPNGLAPGGLQVAPGVPANLAHPTASENPALWTGATLPTQTTSQGQTTVTITQTKPQAILNWQTFNVGKHTTVDFELSSGGSSSWTVFNKILDPTGNPTQILGSIDSPGQVYLINQNGIIFGGSSQVNVHALVASALPINDNLLAAGLLNNPDDQFLFSALPIAAGSSTPAFNPTLEGVATTDPAFTLKAPSHTLAKPLAAGSVPTVTVGSQALTAGVDYNLSNSSGGKTVVTLTLAGLAKAAGTSVTITYSTAAHGKTVQVTDSKFDPVAPVYNLEHLLATGSTLSIETAPTGAGGTALISGVDYTTKQNSLGETTITFTASGLEKMVSSAGAAIPISVSYDEAHLGNVVVQAGAQLTSPTTAAHVGGRIALIGPNVENAGTISTPDGQTILAAGEQVAFAAHPSNDASLRGLDVYVGAVDPSSGTATNAGLIEAPRADVTITGKAVNQFGAIDSSTSVTLNGRIDLLAAYDTVTIETNSGGSTTTATYNQTASGTLTLGPGSVTQILPELSDSETVVGTQLALPSQVNLQGETIHLASNAVILAPNANVTASAGGWYQTGGQSAPVLVPDSGQIYLDAGATINVAGSVVSAPVAENIISAQLLGPQLANSPVQRAGILAGQTIQVDIRETGVYDGQAWIGTPLADVSGYAALIQRPVGELTTAGGTVTLSAGGSVVMQPGSSVNVSGGAINYQGGIVQTTRLVSDGIIYDISQATPDQAYQGIYTGTYTTSQAKYGLSQTYTNPLLLSGAHYEASYVEGANGGAISISAASMALDGSLLGQTITGPRQLVTPPTASALSLSFQAVTNANIQVSPTPPEVIFQTGANLPAAAPFALDPSGNPEPLSQDRQDVVILSPDLLQKDGFGSLTVNDGDGNISVPAKVALAAPASGSITLTAANLNIQGSVTAPGGALDFTVYDFSPNTYLTLSAQPSTPPINPARGNFVLGSAASLSTAGLIVDNRPGSPTANTLPQITNGGTITIASYSADLAAGSTIDVSGGVVVNATGSVAYGKGGSIAISAGEDPHTILGLIGGKLTLDATLTGYSGSTGGSLSILAPSIQIGGSAVATADTLLLNPNFFSQGGFSNFSLTGLGAAIGDPKVNDVPGILISPGTVLAPVAENWVAAENSPTGEGVTLSPVLLPEAQRTPVSLSFSAPGVQTNGGNTVVIRGDFVMGSGASITTDPLANVSINAQTATVLGSIIAPGGTISITGAKDSNLIFDRDITVPLATVYLGPDALLSTSGTVVFTPDVYGKPTGSVLPGGSINLSGNIVAAAGSTLNVSGASGVLYLPQSETTLGAPVFGSFLGAPVVPIRVDSNGGSIALAGAQELFTDATLIGAAGGPTAAGGSLSVSSGRYLLENEVAGFIPSATDPTLLVTQSGLTIPVAFTAGSAAIGQPILGANGKVLSPNGEGHIAVNSFNGGGFNSITLAGTVQFSGHVAITAAGTLTVATGGVIIADGPVSLSAPYVVLGLPFQAPLQPGSGIQLFTTNFNPTFGPGSLTVTANLIDLGNLSLQNIGQANFIAAGGDIRGDGTLDVAGHISLTAGQIYPATDVDFTIAAYDPNITVASSDSGSKTVTLASANLPPGFGKGSSLLGSTVATIDGDVVTLASGADATIGSPTSEVFAPGSGSITVTASGTRALPLSAGGTLSLYGSIINQGGVLRAPMGTINLGWDGTAGTAPTDPITNAPVASTSQLILRSGSITSVSAVDPSTGEGLIIPYGSNPTGSAWLDPSGINITAGGVPGKTINLAGAQIFDQPGSVIDLRGGGDLYAYRFVSGEGGTLDFLGSGPAWAASISYAAGQIVTYKGASWVALQQSSGQTPAVNQYWTQLPASYAVIPGYQASFAPYAPFNSAVGDPGYVSAGLQIGQQVALGAGSGLPAGLYTLLPARYALLPGAFLVTPLTTAPTAAQTLPDGSNLVSGYVFNGFSSPGGTGQSLVSSFQVESAAVIATKGEYDGFLANSFLAQGAVQNKTAIPRLPIDAGQLVFQASSMLAIQGTVDAQAPAGGQGGLVDISSPVDIYITSGGKSGPAGTLTLDSSELSSFGAESLLIGGIRTFSASGTTVNVETNNIEVNNSGSPLTGPDIILVANDKLKLDPGASVQAEGSLTGQAESLVIQDTTVLQGINDTLTFIRGGVPIFFPKGTPGNDTLAASVGGTVTLANGGTTTFSAGSSFTLSAGSSITLGASGGTIAFNGGAGGPIPLVLGDGALLRVSSNSNAPIARTAVASSEAPSLILGAGATVSGASVTLDSTYAATLAPSAVVTGQSIALDSGQISLQLANPGPLPQSNYGLVLTNETLQALEHGAQSLSLLSYSSIDIYGSGTVGSQSLGTLELHAGEIRGFESGSNDDGGSVLFAAQNIILNNNANAPQVDPLAPAGTPLTGTLTFAGGTISLGNNQLDILGYNVALSASGGILGQGSGGLGVQGNLTVSDTPLITGATGANQTITALGILAINAPAAKSGAFVAGGLDASLTLVGSSITEDGNIALPSGNITLHATGSGPGDGITLGGALNVSGTAQTFFDLVETTGGGIINLISDAGSITLAAGSTIAAGAPGANAGSVSISAPHGEFTVDPKAQLLAKGGLGGSFSLDVNDIAATSAGGSAGSVGAIDALLEKGGFTDSIAIRDRSDAIVTVENEGTFEATARSYNLSADQGSIEVTGTIDAAGVTGGTIDLEAFGSITLESGSVLTAAAQSFSDAGKGGAISLEAGSETNGVIGTGSVNILPGSKIDLSVAGASASSAAAGDFTGTLHLRAPQTAGNTDLQVSAIGGSIVGASAIVIEGYQLYSATDGSIDNQEAAVMSNGQSFAGNTAAITARLLSSQSASNAAQLLQSMVVLPGAEIINLNGDLTLANDWDLSQFRFGSESVPGILTLRASGNLVFNGTLSDGFTSASYTALLLPQNTALPVNVQSWSYNLAAGADFSAVDSSRVNAGAGSLLLGLNDSNSPTPGGTTASAVSGYYQVIRTGSGDINISAGANIELLNQFATIYTAGTQVLDATLNGTFSVPVLDETSGVSTTHPFGTTDPAYAAQYSEAGGNVTISAQMNIEHLTLDANGNLIMDSEAELPDNWLYRRGYVAASGVFGSNSRIKGGGDPSESTTWWIDFSNFFEGVGALGGGNVTMIAGEDIANVDAVVPTNARMPGIGPSGDLTPNAGSLVELGGGDLDVRAGHDLNAGAYYVERGQGVLSAGNVITTNSTRSPVGGSSTANPAFTAPPQAWLPTTLFLGDGSFDVSAGGNVLLGPVVNPFLLPEGLGNTIWYKTYFSTYAPDDAVNVSSLTGGITFREAATASDVSGSLLGLWLENMDSYETRTLIGSNPRSYYQPWLRLNETSVAPFSTVTELMPATLKATAYSGDIDIVGSLLLAPSPTGTIDLAARGSINGFQSEGLNIYTSWTSATIDLSDSNPALIPGIASPFAYQGVQGVGTTATAAATTGSGFLIFISNLFDATTTETPGVFQTEEALHAPNLLHANNSNPIELYAAGGSISGLTLYAPEETRVLAGGDITDIAVHLQNNGTNDISVVSAGGDLIAYDPSSPARLAAQTAPGDNVLSASLSGDLDIAGPGALEVLAGANLELGGPGPGGASNSTNDGIASIGNAQNPFLPFAGADIVAAAGLGPSAGLDMSRLDFSAFIGQFIQSAAGARYLSELSDLVGSGTALTATSFSTLKPAEQDLLALDIFYLVLRDAGRDHNNPASAGFGTYTAGFSAISTLLPNAGQGDIDLTGRDIETQSGGNISLLAPGGQITVGLNSGAQTDVTNLGIVTQDGGNISIFASGDVNVGTSRIFTLRGGNEIIWSSTGNIDAGASSKTVQSAPPTRVLVDPQSGDVETDLAGLATGGGIGVLATVTGVAPGNVDLIAPTGIVDAGEAGIRATGNLNIAAVQVLNASNIQVGGTSVGVPTAPVVTAPNLAGLTTASTAAGAGTTAAEQVATQNRNQPPPEDLPSIITVEVLGYGGADDAE